MSKAIVKSTVNAITKEGLEEGFEKWYPSSRADSVKMLHFVSLITKVSKSLKQKAYAYLQENYPESDNAVDAVSGLEVIKVTPKTKVYKTSKETEALEEAIEVKLKELADLKEKLKLEYEKNGMDYEVEGEVYYKAK